MRITVIAEDEICRYEPADNGASPLWCHGSSIIARDRDRVFVTALQTMPEAKPLLNCQWELYARADDRWRRVHRDTKDRTREPSPLVLLDDGQLLVSTNPTRTKPDDYAGPAHPQVERFDIHDLDAPPQTLEPVWDGQPRFSEHSYRTFTTDRGTGDALLINEVGYRGAHWALRERDGTWAGTGYIAFPWCATYPKPQPIRLCYPNVVVRDRAVHYLGVSDIVEPYPGWRAMKKQITGRDWDFDFRRLFYAYTPDITTQPLESWTEIATRDATCGWIQHGDLYVTDNGDVHMLWTERSTDERLRDIYFKDTKLTHTLYHAVRRDGREINRAALAVGGEDADAAIPGMTRLHIDAGGRLYAVAPFLRPDGGQELRIAPLAVAGGMAGGWQTVPLTHTSNLYLAATPRSGTQPSEHLDLVFTASAPTHALRYAHLRIEP